MSNDILTSLSRLAKKKGKNFAGNVLLRFKDGNEYHVENYSDILVWGNDKNTIYNFPYISDKDKRLHFAAYRAEQLVSFDVILEDQ